MREINVSEITDIIEKGLIRANYYLPEDITNSLEKAYRIESSTLCKIALSAIIENQAVANEMNIPICQDTGMAVIFMDIGQDVHFIGGSLKNAIDEGVKRAYLNGYMRCSIVADPLFERKNTDDNTPAVVHMNIIDGENVNISIAPKGFGSENMSQIRMFNPSVKIENIIDFIVSVAQKADANPCPPIVLGVGIGGDFEYSAVLAKKALTLPLDYVHENEKYDDMSKTIIKKINDLRIGSQGFIGDTTILGLNILSAPTHIAGLPVAVNVGCHVNRHINIVL